MGKDLEMITEVWAQVGHIKLINFCNPCKTLTMDLLEEPIVNIEGKI